jgi:hypothetical protein
MSSSSTIRQTLDEIAEADLKIILSEIQPQARGHLLAHPYYVIDDFEQFHGDTALVYQARARLYFFYLEPTLDLCQIRKYRFKRSAASWERYDVALKHTPQKFLDSSGQATTNTQ